MTDDARTKLERAMREVLVTDIYVEFGPLVATMARRVLLCARQRATEEDVEDAISCAWVRVLERVGRFDPERGKLSTWICRLARQGVVDHLQARKLPGDDARVRVSQAPGDYDPISPSECDPGSAYTRAPQWPQSEYTLDRLRVFRALPEKQQRFMLLRVFIGTAGIRAREGCSQQSVNHRNSRIRRRLRAAVEAQ